MSRKEEYIKRFGAYDMEEIRNHTCKLCGKSWGRHFDWKCYKGQSMRMSRKSKPKNIIRKIYW